MSFFLHKNPFNFYFSHHILRMSTTTAFCMIAAFAAFATAASASASTDKARADADEAKTQAYKAKADANIAKALADEAKANAEKERTYFDRTEKELADMRVENVRLCEKFRVLEYEMCLVV